MDSNEGKIRLSVIVPFYNAERHIAQCVRSLMAQTLWKEVEFIFVDDGSTDQSAEILKTEIAAFPHRARQIIIVRNDHNRGSAYSRQRGFDMAHGEFVVHCDADDWVDASMYADLLREADTTGADMVCTPYFLETGRKTRTVSFPSLDFPTLNDMPLDTLHCSLCTRLIRRSVLTEHDIRFFEGVDCWEDLGIIFRAMIFTRRIVIYNKPYYHYRKETADSLTTRQADRVLSDHLRFVEAADAWFALQPPELAKTYSPFIRFLQFTAKIKMLRGRHRDIHRWKTTFPESNRSILSYKNIPFFYRICFYLAHRMPECLIKALLAATSVFQKKIIIS